jgi:hypothetical protein
MTLPNRVLLAAFAGFLPGKSHARGGGGAVLVVWRLAVGLLPVLVSLVPAVVLRVPTLVSILLGAGLLLADSSWRYRLPLSEPLAASAHLTLRHAAPGLAVCLVLQPGPQALRTICHMVANDLNNQERKTGQASRSGPSPGGEHERAESDYQRLRAAYLKLANDKRGNDVGLAMIGADMERAHAWLQRVAALQSLPRASRASGAPRRGSQRLASHEP